MMESYDGEKEEYAWNEVFKLPEIQKLNLSPDVQSMLTKATQNKGVDVEEGYIEE